MRGNEVHPGVWQYTGRNSNAFALRASGEVWAIDSGFLLDRRALPRELDAWRGSTPLVGVILTHYHIDHTGAVAPLARRAGKAVYTGEHDLPILERRVPIPDPEDPRARRMSRLFNVLAMRRLRGVRPLRDGERVGPFRVVNTPGHTPGHISLVWEEGGVLFAGDALGHGDGKVEPLLHFASSHEQARRSVHNLVGLDLQLAVFGHGDPLPNPDGAIRAAAELVGS